MDDKKEDWGMWEGVTDRDKLYSRINTVNTKVPELDYD